MKFSSKGFLLVEIMVTVAVVTVSIALLMSYQARTMAWQHDGIALMESTEESQRILLNKTFEHSGDGRINMYPLTRPAVDKNSSSINSDFFNSFQVVIFKDNRPGDRECQQCTMPAVIVRKR
jgi:hypothetical protein